MDVRIFILKSRKYTVFVAGCEVLTIMFKFYHESKMIKTLYYPTVTQIYNSQIQLDKIFKNI